MRIARPSNGPLAAAHAAKPTRRKGESMNNLHIKWFTRTHVEIAEDKKSAKFRNS